MGHVALKGDGKRLSVGKTLAIYPKAQNYGFLTLLCTVFLYAMFVFLQGSSTSFPASGGTATASPMPRGQRMAKAISRTTIESIPAISAAYRPAAQYERKPVKSFCRLSL